MKKTKKLTKKEKQLLTCLEFELKELHKSFIDILRVREYKELLKKLVLE